MSEDVEAAPPSAPVAVRAHTGRLVFTPQDAQAAPALDLLISSLVELGFIGERLADATEAFAVGQHFLSLLSFAGCAVQIVTEPAAGLPFCHIRVESVQAQPRLCHGRNTRAPRCPNCRARLSGWRERIAAWEEQPRYGICCPSCGETRPPWLWDWKQQGGFGRCFLFVEEVFPGEAAPTSTLLEQLTLASGTRWRYFYVQD